MTIPLPCTCANLRRAERVVTNYYDAMLRPTGLHVSQFTLLQALTQAPGIAQKQLANLLEIDSTTLTRTLAPLRKKGWMSSKTGVDRRELRLSLTAAGKREYQRALPDWEKAQNGLKKALGEQNWTRLLEATVRTAEAAGKLAPTSQSPPTRSRSIHSAAPPPKSRPASARRR